MCVDTYARTFPTFCMHSSTNKGTSSCSSTQFACRVHTCSRALRLNLKEGKSNTAAQSDQLTELSELTSDLELIVDASRDALHLRPVPQRRVVHLDRPKTLSRLLLRRKGLHGLFAAAAAAAAAAAPVEALRVHRRSRDRRHHSQVYGTRARATAEISRAAEGLRPRANEGQGGRHPGKR